MPAPSSKKYALGRNTIFGITYNGSTSNICVSEGSIDLSADMIEIANNCNSGWKIKLPGNKQGTMTLTGYLATKAGNGPLTWLGEVVAFTCLAFDSDENDQGQSMEFGGEATVTGARVSIDSNDACRVEMTLELTGAPSNTSFMLLATSN
jgi:hypothetical protein